VLENVSAWCRRRQQTTLIRMPAVQRFVQTRVTTEVYYNMRFLFFIFLYSLDMHESTYITNTSCARRLVIYFIAIIAQYFQARTKNSKTLGGGGGGSVLVQ